MGEITIDFFGEDAGHELFLRALLKRMVTDLALLPPSVHAVSARGGHGKAIAELKGWLKARSGPFADILIVMIDGNSVGATTRRAEVERVIEGAAYPETVIGCPDREVEVWLLADPGALARSLNIRASSISDASTTDAKSALRDALAQAGEIVLGDPVQIAMDVVPEIDIHAARRQSPSFEHFVDSLRGALQRVSNG